MATLQTLDGRPLSWEQLEVMNAAYWRRGWRSSGPHRADRQIARGIAITPLGRAVLAGMRAREAA